MPDLVADHLPLACEVARSFTRRWRAHRDDIEGVALLTLCRVAADFDESRGVPFAGFAAPRVAWAIRDYLRTVAPRPFPARRSAGTDPAFAAIDAADFVAARLRCLPPRHREVVWLLHGLGLTQSEAARAVGVSQAQISCIDSESFAVIHADTRGDRP